MNLHNLVLTKMKTGCFYRAKDIAIEAGLSPEQVRPILNSLSKGQIVIKEKRSKENIYTSLQPDLLDGRY